MRTIFSLPYSQHSILLVILFVVLCFQLYVCCMEYFYKLKLFHCKVLFLITVISLLLLSFLSSCTYSKFLGESMLVITRNIMNIPVLVIYLYIIMTVVYSYWIMGIYWKYKKSSITKESVKEGVDLISTGLCFFKKSGLLILVNLQMEKLSHILCGEYLQNGERFWQCISKGDLKSGARRGELLSIPAVILPDESAWIFDKQILYLNDEEIVQVTAMDVTELYNLANKLKKNNTMLRDMNVRLKLYRRNVENLTRTQQRLAMKMQIHDSIGQNLMMTRYYLANEAQESTEQGISLILQKWKKTISLLRRELEYDEPKKVFKHLIDAAESAGVKVILQGEIPKEERIVELIINAGAEALTNAVRHAGAKELKIQFSQTGLVYCAVFTNDGRLPNIPLKEGGGLTGLRKRIESEGGTMTVSANPDFSLEVTIPNVGKENII